MDKPLEKEWWIDLIEYSGYAVSESGKILNTRSGTLKQPSTNQQGILMVNFSILGRQCVRSVALLVADHFVDRRDFPDHFDTPIHLNGDKTDCQASNLAWRPRWFAIMYHQQFRKPNFGVPSFVQPIKLQETGQVYVNTWDAVMDHGLLENRLVVATMNREPTPPFNMHFVFV